MSSVLHWRRVAWPELRNTLEQLAASFSSRKQGSGPWGSHIICNPDCSLPAPTLPAPERISGGKLFLSA